MRVYVAGSFDTPDDIRRVVRTQGLLREAGIEVLNQLDVSFIEVRDFRGRAGLARRIVEHDLGLVGRADAVIALADKPSFGTAIEVFFAKHVLKRSVIVLATKPVRSPWVVAFADKVARDEPELVRLVKEMAASSGAPGGR
ncbi:TPA: hypothetical protein EYP44_01175 [Candidatus Bathyarchaeota archaeon]|nr:hypothetical protein [Candidatus Bathyarchaeota archaeon]